MKREAGLWIDHRKAVIVTVTEDGLETKQIQSNMEKHVRFSSGSSEDGSAEDMRDRQFANHLSSFYDEVIAAIRDVDAILILGPGEAKGELVKRLERDEVGGRIVGLESVDKMTDRQIAERVRQQFHVQKSTSLR
jgi:stalled ribosome rescue protein Dom34